MPHLPGKILAPWGGSLGTQRAGAETKASVRVLHCARDPRKLEEPWRSRAGKEAGIVKAAPA